MERLERHRGFRVGRGRRGTRRAVATLAALLLGACIGSSARDDDDSDDERGCRRDDDCARGQICVDVDGNRDETCGVDEVCVCALVTPGAAGRGGTAGGAGSGGSGGSTETGGTAGRSDGGDNGDAGDGGGSGGSGASGGSSAVAGGGSGGRGGGGGRAGSGGSSAVGGGGNGANAGASGTGGCTGDDECTGAMVCIDNIRGDGDGFCETGEACTCVGVGVGGAGGRGGAPSGGAGGRGGSGGGNGAALGAPCRSAADCGGTPFVCLASNGLSDRSGPPNGLCTIACATDDPCIALDSLAYCVGFTSTEAYCVQGCRGGAAYAPKCHLRDDFACGILDTTPTRIGCLSSNDCGAGQVCLDQVCQNMITACIPTCGGDFDCGSGQYCDFASGFCVPVRPTGLPIGSLCDPTLATDPCNGFCQATDSTGSEGTCGAFCSASLTAVGCGWNGQGTAEAGCLFATIVSRDASGDISLAESDLMLCGKLCDCNADCVAANDYCLDENAGDPAASIQALFGRGGYCRPLLSGETTADSLAVCP